MVRLVGGAALLSLFAFRLYFPGENFLPIDSVSISVLTGVFVPITQGWLTARTTTPPARTKGQMIWYAASPRFSNRR